VERDRRAVEAPAIQTQAQPEAERGEPVRRDVEMVRDREYVAQLALDVDALREECLREREVIPGEQRIDRAVVAEDHPRARVGRAERRAVRQPHRHRHEPRERVELRLAPRHGASPGAKHERPARPSQSTAARRSASDNRSAIRRWIMRRDCSG
jgi:hypothetical protein